MESEELLLTRGTDPQASEVSQASNRHGSSSFYELESHENGGIAVLRENQRLHWDNGGVGSGNGGVGAMNGPTTTTSGGIASSVSMKTIRRRYSHRRMRIFHTWASRINCFAAGIFLTTGML